MERNIFTEEHLLFRRNVRAWVDEEDAPYKDVRTAFGKPPIFAGTNEIMKTIIAKQMRL
jgi:hypothetical protein